MAALASFCNDNAARGYNVGREYYFIDAQPDERMYTDMQLIERLQELERESVEFHEEENTWYYALGCILGELSGQLFPATSQCPMGNRPPILDSTSGLSRKFVCSCHLVNSVVSKVAVELL